MRRWAALVEVELSVIDVLKAGVFPETMAACFEHFHCLCSLFSSGRFARVESP